MKSFDVVDYENLDMLNTFVDPRNIETNKICHPNLNSRSGSSSFNSKRDIEELTRCFNVSKTMMTVRLKQLDWLK